jgi:hypothetical protein
MSSKMAGGYTSVGERLDRAARPEEIGMGERSSMGWTD